jgi:hypothetical protein
MSYKIAARNAIRGFGEACGGPYVAGRPLSEPPLALALLPALPQQASDSRTGLTASPAPDRGRVRVGRGALAVASLVRPSLPQAPTRRSAAAVLLGFAWLPVCWNWKADILVADLFFRQLLKLRIVFCNYG